MSLRCQISPSCWLAAVASLAAVSAWGCGETEVQISDANQRLIDAQGLIAAGDTSGAMEALNESIEIEPSMWSLFARAKLHEQLGDDAKALSDCEAALQLESGEADLLWFKKELSKPKAERFRGQLQLPPSHYR